MFKLIGVSIIVLLLLLGMLVTIMGMYYTLWTDDSKKILKL